MDDIHYTDEEFKHNLDMVVNNWKQINKSLISELNEYSEQLQIESDLFNSLEKLKSYKPIDKILLIFYACWIIITAFKFVSQNLKGYHIDLNNIKYFRDIGISLYKASKNLIDKQFFRKETFIDDFDISCLQCAKEKKNKNQDRDQDKNNLVGGDLFYKQKYFLYKQKYLALKHKLDKN